MHGVCVMCLSSLACVMSGLQWGDAPGACIADPAGWYIESRLSEFEVKSRNAVLDARDVCTVVILRY